MVINGTCYHSLNQIETKSSLTKRLLHFNTPSDDPVYNYSDVIMRAKASQITSVSIVCSTASYRSKKTPELRSRVDSYNKKPVKRKIFPFDDVIMYTTWKLGRLHRRWSLGMGKWFYPHPHPPNPHPHPTTPQPPPPLYNGCNYLSMARLNLNHVSKRGPCKHGNNQAFWPIIWK